MTCLLTAVLHDKCNSKLKIMNVDLRVHGQFIQYTNIAYYRHFFDSFTGCLIKSPQSQAIIFEISLFSYYYHRQRGYNY